jgi:hypothetical protein
MFEKIRIGLFWKRIKGTDIREYSLINGYICSDITSCMQVEKFMNKYLILSIFCLIVSCKEKVEYGDAKLTEKIDLTRIETLKKQPEGFNNDTIRIKGKVFIEWENVAIVNDEFSIWINSFEPAIGMELADESDKKLNGKNVELIGIYKAGMTGHLGRYNGRLSEIFYIKSN